MIGRQFKRCSQRQQSKPLTAFYLNAAYYPDKNGPRKESASPKPRWKMCIRRKRKRQPEQFPSHIRNPDGRTRICRACFADIMKPTRSTGKSIRGRKSRCSSSGSFGHFGS